MRRVVVTGVGVVSPVGNDPREFFDNLLRGRSGLRLRAADPEVGLEPTVLGMVEFEAEDHMSRAKAKQLDRVTQFALVAGNQAMKGAGLALSEEECLRAGVSWGTGLGGIQTMEDGYIQIYRDRTGRARPMTVVMSMNNAAAAQLSIEFGLRGPNRTISNACASSAMAIGEALHTIRYGQADVMIAGGSEALLTPGTIRAWQMMGALAQVDRDDPAASCKPFDAERNGLVLGEGAAALVLEEEEHARRRGARVLCELAGYGTASDALHLSKPDAGGQVRAMRLALDDARLNADAIGYVNAHGTATPLGDVVETRALRRVFDDRAPPVSSTKAVHGHLMGGAGAVEMVASVLALHQQVLPPTAHLSRPDPQCDLDYLADGAREVEQLEAVMSNSFAFGGSNAVLVARRYS